MGEILTARRNQTNERFARLKNLLESAEKILANKACVYVTGSVARGEAGQHSDLDLFIVGVENEKQQRSLSRLDEILLKAQLIEKSREVTFPDFSGDGEYLAYYSRDELLKRLGTRDDDAENTFTARLLLLLESRPLLGQEAYDSVIDNVIASYWRDYEKNKGSFVPAFLANDILRIWKTFCVNYEARTQDEPQEERAKRRLLNYKLKHSRMLTCYSAIVYLARVFSAKKTVSPADAKAMVGMTPTERLEWLKEDVEDDKIKTLIDTAITSYEKFLNNTDAAKDALIAELIGDDRAQVFKNDAREFGDQMFALLSAVGREDGGGEYSQFYRFLVV